MDAENNAGGETPGAGSGTAGGPEATASETGKPAVTSGASTASESQTTSPQTSAEGATTTDNKEEVKPTPGKGASRRRAVDVGDYQKRKTEALAPAPKPAAGEKPAGGETAAAPAKPATAKPEQGKPAIGSTSAEATADSTGADGAGEEEAVATDTKVPDRIRLGKLSERDKALVNAANNLVAGGECANFGDAWDRVSGKASQKARDEVARATGEEQGAGATDGAARSIEDIRKDIAEQKAARKTAASSLDTTGMVEIDDKLDDLRDELSKAERAQERAEEKAATAEERKFNGEVASFKKQTVEAYPTAADKDSPLSKRVVEIATLMESQGNDLVFQPQGIFKIHQMAANELGIAPVDPAKKPKEKPAVTTNNESSTSTATPKPQGARQQSAVTSKPAGPAASGNARTTGGGPAENPVLAKKARTVEDYEAKKSALGLTPA